MATIDTTQTRVTLINVHTCEPTNQHALATVLAEGIDTIYRHIPGFISASIHVSVDGVRVTNYAQYTSCAAVESAWSHPEVPAFAAKVGALIQSFDAHLYDVLTVVPS